MARGRLRGRIDNTPERRLRPTVAIGLDLVARLGIATGGLGAMLPLLDFGGAQDSNCAELIQAAGNPGQGSAGTGK
jgi:hypothetical protein